MSKVGHVGRVLVIGFWGFPGGWLRAKYQPVIVVDKPEKYSSWTYSNKPYESRSSTLALARALIEKSSADVKVAIYGLDTLASPPKIEPSLRQIFESCPGNYEDVAGRAKHVLELYVHRFAEETGLSLSSIIESIDVVPGVGTFRVKDLNMQYRYTGSPINSFDILILKILDLLKKVQPDIVILDVSHGINYLPIVGREAVIIATETYTSLVTARKKVVLVVVNSDPVQMENQLSRIHLVELHCYEHEPLGAITKLSNSLAAYEKPIDVKPLGEARLPQEVIKYRDESKNIMSNYKKIIDALKNVFNYGLILYLFHIVTNKLSRDSIKRDLESLRKVAINMLSSREITVRQEGNEIIVDIRQSYVVEPGLIYLILILDLLCTLIDEASNITKDTINGMLNLKKLKDLSEKLGVSEVGKLLLERDCAEIHNIVCEVLPYLEERGINTHSLEVSLDKLFELKSVLEKPTEITLEKLQEYLKQDYTKCPIDLEKAKQDVFMKRNFYAHSGLERKVTKILITGKKEEEIYVGYIESCKDIIEELAKPG